MTTEEWAAAAAGCSATAAAITLAHTLYQHRYVQDLKRKEILVEFMRTTYYLRRDRDKLVQKWYQIVVHWDSPETAKVLKVLRCEIKEFHAPYKMRTSDDPNDPGKGIVYCSSQWAIYSAKRRALEKLNITRTKLCKQMCSEMCPLVGLRPSLCNIVPFEAIIKSPF